MRPLHDHFVARATRSVKRSLMGSAPDAAWIARVEPKSEEFCMSMLIPNRRRFLLPVSLLGLALSLIKVNAAAGQVPGGASARPDSPTATDIGTVSATGAGGLSAAPQPGTAAYVAPSRAPLDASQPTSIVGQHFIDRSVVPTQNYDSIIKFSPSVQNIEPVGAGLQQNFLETIRGFTYKQFNTTFDGLVLPGTISSFAPQSEAYFMAHDIGSVRVDRGPGTASTIGYATFGGTVDIRSKEPLDSFTVNPFTTVGSLNTLLTGVELDSGVRPELNGARGYLDLQALNSDGYLTGTSTMRRNAFSKIEVPIGDNTVITFVGMVNTSYNHTPIGATLAQIGQRGANYGLNQDPTSQAFKGYNADHYSADFEYVRVKSNLGDGWGIEETPYTASYYHGNIVGLDPNGTTPNLTGRYFINGTATALTNAVPGRAAHSDFRDWGNVVRVTKDTGYGQARAGLWFDNNAAGAYRTNILLSQHNVEYTRNTTASATDYNYHTTLRTYQPYFEFALQPVPELVITPGLKYTSTTRYLDAGSIRARKFQPNSARRMRRSSRRSMRATASPRGWSATHRWPRASLRRRLVCCRRRSHKVSARRRPGTTRSVAPGRRIASRCQAICITSTSATGLPAGTSPARRSTPMAGAPSTRGSSSKAPFG